MCGIAGIVGPPERGIDPAVAARMNAMLRHRGPDGEGMYTEPGVALAMRRLAIIDIAGGDQPIANEDESVWIVFNGEIYNFEELRDRLLALGHRFRTHSDTEAVVHAYEEFGADCPKYLRGMFAFAIWDKRKEQLFIARDRVGKKPLLYAQRGDTLIFASEFRAMLAHPDISREIDPEAIHHYLSFMCVPAPLTAYRDIRKLEPGHSLTWKKGRVSIQRYWSLDFVKKRPMSEREAAHEVLHTLSEAVRLRMISEVPIGAFLSGGIDSSAVVALMAEQSSQPVKTFSIGFDESDFDELVHARRIAKRFGTDHHEFVVRPDAAAILPMLADHYGEPFADSSAIPTYYVARETRKHVTVALNGDGGDEAFAGYRRYAAMKLAAWMRKAPAALRRAAARATMSVSSTGNRRTKLGEIRRFAGAALLPPGRSYMTLIGAFDETAKRRMYSPEFAARLEAGDSAELIDRYLDDKQLDGTDAVQRADTMMYLPDDLLVKADIATMACSLEARSPFLDHHVLELAAALPANLKLHGLTTKYILKKALHTKVPDENLHRKKMGFGVPVGSWMRGELRAMTHELLLPDRLRAHGILNPPAVMRFVDDHLAERRDWSNQLWTLLMLELWFERFIDSDAAMTENCTSVAAAS